MCSNKELISRYLSSGGKVEKISTGFAIGYIPDFGHSEVDDLAQDTISVLIYGNFIGKIEKQNKK
jgi:hypothetical protein